MSPKPLALWGHRWELQSQLDLSLLCLNVSFPGCGLGKGSKALGEGRSAAQLNVQGREFEAGSTEALGSLILG